jgi:hypothetical protein
MNANHARALDSVKENLLPGTVAEVVSKKPWGFGELPRAAVIGPGQAIKGYFDNIILHILYGEGIPLDELLAIKASAEKACARLLILEHHPSVAAAARSVSIAQSEAELRKVRLSSTFPITLEPIDNRNFLMVSTMIPGGDESWNGLNTSTLPAAFSRRWQGFPTPHPVFTLTSELHEYGITLPQDREWVKEHAAAAPLYCAVGGLMFLKLIEELPCRPVFLFDRSLLQILYALTAVGVLLEKKDAYFRPLDSLLRPAYSEGTKVLRRWMQEAPAQVRYWINLVWRMTPAQKSLLAQTELHWHCGGLPGLAIPEGAVLYASTIREAFVEPYRDTVHIFEALSRRNFAAFRPAGPA